MEENKQIKRGPEDEVEKTEIDQLDYEDDYDDNDKVAQEDNKSKYDQQNENRSNKKGFPDDGYIPEWADEGNGPAKVSDSK